MSNYFVQRDIDLSSLKSSFDAWNFSCLEVQVGLSENNLITVFCCQTQHLENMKQDWERINSEITADYLLKSRSDFEHWNTYLLLICSEKIPKNIHYKIENDTFAMRKIVATNKLLNSDHLSQIANQKILSSKITLEKIEFNAKIKPIFSEITTRLLRSKVTLGQSPSDLDSRVQWLNDELERITTNED